MTETAPPRITLKRIEYLERESPRYSDFMRDLEAVFNLRSMNPGRLKWLGLPAMMILNELPPRMELDLIDGAPRLSVTLHPRIEGKSEDITDKHPYDAPLIFADVDRWETSGLRNYQITRRRGVIEGESRLTQPVKLADVFRGLNPATPVIHAVAILPQSRDGTYVTEFAPRLSRKINTPYRIKLTSAVEDGINVPKLLSSEDDLDIPFLDVDPTRANVMSNWKADFVPDMSDIEKLMLPSSKGHMVILAEPSKDLVMPKLDLGYGFGEDQFRSFGGGLSRSMGGGMKSSGGSFGEASISRGSRVGQASRFTGELVDAKNGKKVIYHVKLLMFRPDQELDVEGLRRASDSVDNYVSLN